MASTGAHIGGAMLALLLSSSASTAHAQVRVSGCSKDDVNRPARQTVTIALAGDRGKWSATTDEKGCYAIDGVPAGTYTFKAESPGFQPVTASVEVSSTDNVSFDVILRPGQTDLVETVRADPNVFGIIGDVMVFRDHDPSLVELWGGADAVVHLRVDKWLSAMPWALGGNLASRVISTEFRASVIEVLKAHPLAGPAGPTLTFLQTYAGVWRDGSGRSWRSSGGPEELHVAGDELVAFLRWDAAVERLCLTVGFPVLAGRVFPNAAITKAIAEASPLKELLTTLRAMRR
jgi:hypothetical protein